MTEVFERFCDLVAKRFSATTSRAPPGSPFARAKEALGPRFVTVAATTIGARMREAFVDEEALASLERPFGLDAMTAEIISAAIADIIGTLPATKETETP